MKINPLPQRSRARQVPKIPKGWRKLRPYETIERGDKYLGLSGKWPYTGLWEFCLSARSQPRLYIRRITPASALSPDSLKSTARKAGAK